MQSLSFIPGRALLESSPTNRSWSLRFEDEGIAGYLYVCDRALGHGDDSILDSMLIYNVAALREAATRTATRTAQESTTEESTTHSSEPEAGTSPDDTPAAGAAHTPDSVTPSNTSPAGTAQGTSQAAASHLSEPERLAAIEWSRDGLQAVLYLDGTAQAMADFSRRISFCRSDFPNFLAEGTERWRASTHAWDPAAIEHFEAALYA